MSLIPYEPFRQLTNMRRELDRFFSDFSFPFHDERHFGGIRVDVYETDNEVVATCDLPGLESKDDVDISIENNHLIISGSINRSNEVKHEQMFQRERYVGRFQRMVMLPSPVSHEGVKATYKNGVLEVRMPKLASDTKKKIDIDFH